MVFRHVPISRERSGNNNNVFGSLKRRPKLAVSNLLQAKNHLSPIFTKRECEPQKIVFKRICTWPIKSRMVSKKIFILICGKEPDFKTRPPGSRLLTERFSKKGKKAAGIPSCPQASRRNYRTTVIKKF